MKKTLLTLIMLVSIGIYSTQAQITINNGDVVNAGEIVENAQDTLPIGFSIGSSGATSWNFATLSEDQLDTLAFMNPTPLPGSSNFPTSNIGLVDSEEDSSWIYLTKNGIGLFIDGIYQIEDGNGSAIPFQSTIITFPSTYLTSYGGTATIDLGGFPIGIDPDSLLVPPFTNGPHGYVDSLKITRTTTLTSNMDAWGNVTTPFGTFPSLRQNVIEESVDTTWQLVAGNWEIVSTITVNFLAALPPPFGPINVNQVEYDTNRTARWWTDDPTARFPIVEMDYEANGTVNNVDWQKSSPTVGINEKANSTKEINLYPNPAKNEITIETSYTTNNNIQILDVTGRIISNSSFTTNKITLSVLDFKTGVYFYKILDVNGNVLHTNKFVVAK